MGLTKCLRQQARYQIERSAVEMFVSMLEVYENLEPELRAHGDQMIEAMRAKDSTEEEWILSMHTLMELLLGEESIAIDDQGAADAGGEG